ncbi:hypothetical protein FE257_000033 [Aspergillus nanangensis]|uniref:Amidohydrolase-related domain-containing protein n=1 Tax=Aspergillus nanangensis TaxID=2582783 RepID=A0AAD4CZ29_ASPNN|nr:hypothetical protein FE257_000033 [Aspergillus nanangensis]
MTAPWTPPPPRPYILTNATIINPLDGSLTRNATVQLSNGLIQTITTSPSPQRTPPNLTTTTITIDLTGKYLCPGLIDSHVHLTAVPGGRTLAETLQLNPERIKLRLPFVCQQILRRGFTTVRDCGGAYFALKEALSANIIQGPRLFLAGHALTQTGGHGDPRDSFTNTQPTSCCGGMILGIGRIVDGVDECVKAARDELRQGADFVKIMTSGGVASPTDTIEQVQFSAEEVAAITGVARQRGAYVTAHAYSAAAIRLAIENGVGGIEHGNLMDRETARMMAAKGVFLTPTMVSYVEIASEKWRGFLPAEMERKNQEVLDAGLQSLVLAREDGVTMCYGTDLLGGMTDAETGEFAIRAKVLGAREILQSATVNPARMLGMEGRLGQVKEGFVADLLVLDANPLEYITVLDAPERFLLAVLKEGRVQVSRWSKWPQDVFGELPVIE